MWKTPLKEDEIGSLMGPNSFTVDFRSLPFLLNRTEGLDSAAFGFHQHTAGGVKGRNANLERRL